jgi:hypothetical protein
MSEIDANLDRAAAAYWLSVASKGGGDKQTALARAVALLRDGQAETRIPDSTQQPTLNELEAPPLDLLQSRRLRL